MLSWCGVAGGADDGWSLCLSLSHRLALAGGASVREIFCPRCRLCAPATAAACRRRRLFASASSFSLFSAQRLRSGRGCLASSALALASMCAVARIPSSDLAILAAIQGPRLRQLATLRRTHTHTHKHPPRPNTPSQSDVKAGPDVLLFHIPSLLPHSPGLIQFP